MDFSTGKIYKVSVLGALEYYIGSTNMSLSKRFYYHKVDYKKDKDKGANTKLLFEKYGIEKCKIELYEEYPCDT